MSLSKILDIKDQGEIVLDIESNHAEIHSSDWELWGCGFCRDKLSVYIEDKEEIKSAIDCIIEKRIPIVAHNAVFDLRGLHKAGFIKAPYFPVVFDTMIGINLIDSSLNENELGLKATIKRVFEHSMENWLSATAKGKGSKDFFDYAKEDVFWTYRLWNEFVKPKLLLDGKLWELMNKLYCSDILYVCEQEDRGVMWDIVRANMLMGKIDGLETNYGKFIKESSEKIIEIIGEDVNINSNAQLGKRLFVDLRYDASGVPMTLKSKSYQLTKEVIERLAIKYPVFEYLLRYKNANKMVNTYLEPNTERAIAHGRIYPRVHFTSKSGRKRQSDPNFQNQPVIPDKNLNIRMCVIAPPNHKLCVCDLSQMELRLCAHISGDVEMRRAYCEWQCRGCNTAGTSKRYLTHCPNCGLEGNEKTIKDKTYKGFWHGLDIHRMTAEATGLPRNPSLGIKAAAKNANFALIYFATAWKMALTFGTYSEEQWQSIIDLFFKKYRGVREWHKQIEELLMTTRCVRDIFGRKRELSEKEISFSRKHALNMLINFPVQSSGAHYLMLVKRELRRTLIEEKVWLNGVYPSNEVHDELILEVRDEYVKEVGEIMLEKYRYVTQLEVPINAELHIVDRWGEAK